MKTLEKCMQIIANRLSMRLDQVAPTDKLITDRGADSLDIAEIEMEIEDEFGVSYMELGEEDISIQAVADMVDQKLAEVVK